MKGQYADLMLSTWCNLSFYKAEDVNKPLDSLETLDYRPLEVVSRAQAHIFTTGDKTWSAANVVILDHIGKGKGTVHPRTDHEVPEGE